MTLTYFENAKKPLHALLPQTVGTEAAVLCALCFLASTQTQRALFLPTSVRQQCNYYASSFLFPYADMWKCLQHQRKRNPGQDMVPFVSQCLWQTVSHSALNFEKQKTLSCISNILYDFLYYAEKEPAACFAVKMQIHKGHSFSPYKITTAPNWNAQI